MAGTAPTTAAVAAMVATTEIASGQQRSDLRGDEVEVFEIGEIEDL